MKGERELIRIYRAAASELKEKIRSVDALEMTAGDAERIRTFTRRLVMALNLAVADWSMAYLADAYDLSARKAQVALEILGKKPKRPIIDRPDVGIIQTAVAVMVSANNSIKKTVSDFLDLALLGSRTVSGAQVQEFDKEDAAAGIEGAATEAVKVGASRGVLKRQIRELLKALISEDGFIVINGRTWRMTKYAEMVARTELRKAQTDAVKEKCREFDNDLVEVSDHGTECEICEEIEGNIYSLSGRHPVYPTMPIDFPPHPNCMHSLHPTSDIAISFRE